MAGKYQITAEVTITREVDPEGDFTWDSVDFETDYVSSDSNTYSSDVTVEASHSLVFTVEADSEDEAHERGDEVLSNLSFDGADGYWDIDNSHIDNVECIEAPMDLERAQQILMDLADGSDQDDVRAAVAFVFGHIAALTARVDLLASRQ